MQLRRKARLISSDRYRFTKRPVFPGNQPKPHRPGRVRAVRASRSSRDLEFPDPALFSLPDQETYWGVFTLPLCDSGTAVNHMSIGEAMKTEL